MRETGERKKRGEETRSSKGGGKKITLHNGIQAA